jgi:hypothetical protein
MRLIGLQRGAPIRKTTPPNISKVTPNVRTLDEQLTSFGTFIDFVHHLGATQVQAAAGATISGDGQKVELFFSHGDFSDARYGYRAKTPGEDAQEKRTVQAAIGLVAELLRRASDTTCLQPQFNPTS